MELFSVADGFIIARSSKNKRQEQEQDTVSLNENALITRSFAKSAHVVANCQKSAVLLSTLQSTVWN